MNWKITMLEFGSCGLLFVAFWIPFRMGRAGVRNLWCILVGWFALFGLLFTLATLPLIFGNRGGALDSDLANALPDGQIALPFLLFGWLYAWERQRLAGKVK